jgi:FAD/FMN-containing dehydrogenase
MAAEDTALRRLTDRVQAARADQTPLDIRGGGSKAFYGGVPRGEPLDLCELAGISSYEPTELVVTVRAGTPLAELEALLAERGQCLAFEPPRFSSSSTVGGTVAAGLSGPSRASAGSVRDHVLGATLLNGHGELLSFGGQVMKNVAGYDVSRLLAGSLGVLGVICEVSLKVLPLPTARATLRFEMDEAQALTQLNRWGGQPLPIDASAWHGGELLLRLSGARAAVGAACTRLGGEQLAADTAAARWDALRDQHHPFFQLSAGGLVEGEALWRLSVPSSALPLSLPRALAGDRLIEWGGAQRWWRGRTADAAAVRAAAAAVGGHATLFRGADKSAGVFAPLAPPVLRIHRGLKQAFDPDRLFNRGRLYDELDAAL